MKLLDKNYTYLLCASLGALATLGFVATFSASCKKETDNNETYDSYHKTFNKELENVFNLSTGFGWNNNNIELVLEPIDDYDQYTIIGDARNKILKVLQHSPFIVIDGFHTNDSYITPPIPKIQA